MRILISTTPNIYFNVTSFTLTIPSYNIAKIGAVVRHNHDVRLLDNNMFLSKPHDLWTYLKIFRPHIAGFSCPTPALNSTMFELAGEIRDRYPNIILIAGGQSPTYYFDDFLKHSFDYVVLYEGEETFKEITDYLSGTFKGRLSDIKGIAYKDKGVIKKNALRGYIENLDTLPVAARDLLDYNGTLGGVGKFTLIEASRGCQYHCKFCTQPDLWKGVRVFSNRYILKEMHMLKEQGYRELLFTDDSVIGDGDCLNSAEKLAELFEHMISENLGFVFGMSFRAESIVKHPELISLGSKAGLIFSVVGFESYSTRSLRAMDKHSTLKMNEMASKILRGNNILIWGAHVYAFPTQTKDDLKMTIKGGLKHSDIARFTMYTPLKGSRIYHELIESGALNEKDFEKFDFFHHLTSGEKRHSYYKMKMIIGLLTFYLYYKTVITAIYSSDKLKTRLTRKAYKGAFLFVFFKVMRMLGLKIL